MWILVCQRSACLGVRMPQLAEEPSSKGALVETQLLVGWPGGRVAWQGCSRGMLLSEAQQQDLSVVLASSLGGTSVAAI